MYVTACLVKLKCFSTCNDRNYTHNLFKRLDVIGKHMGAKLNFKCKGKAIYLFVIVANTSLGIKIAK